MRRLRWSQVYWVIDVSPVFRVPLESVSTKRAVRLPFASVRSPQRREQREGLSWRSSRLCGKFPSSPQSAFLQLVYHTLDAILDERDIPVDQKSQSPPRELQMRDQLGVVDRLQGLHRLVLDDDFLRHEHVDAIPRVNVDIIVFQRLGNLAFHVDPPLAQLVRQTRLVSRFQKSRPQCPMHLHHGIDQHAGCRFQLVFAFPRAIRSFHREGAKNAKIFLGALRAFAVDHVIAHLTEKKAGLHSVFCSSPVSVSESFSLNQLSERG